LVALEADGKYMGRASVVLACLGSAGFWALFPNADSMLVQSTRAGSTATTAKQARTALEETTFENIGMGEMEDENGVHLGFTDFKASDGIGLIVLYESFGSPERALNYFEKQLAKAAKVIERKNKLSPERKIIGERAEILLRLNPQKAIPAVLWTDGEKFHEIYSSSLKEILQLEKVYKY
jgi:hypothetical protein